MRDKLVELVMKRMRMLGFKGKARDNATLEFFVGATAALEAAGLDNAEVGKVSFIAFMVSVRGYAYLEEIEKKEAA